MPIIGNRLNEPVSFPKQNSEWHEFLNSRFKHDRVDAALRIKTELEKLPNTAATIADRRLRRKTGLPRGAYTDDVMHLLGSWRVPEHYSNGKTSWVNPNYENRQRHADAAVVCECGTPTLRERFGKTYEQPIDVEEHDEGCCRLNRVEARAEMWRKRRAIIKKMTGLGHSFRQTNFRLGFAGETAHGNKLAEKCGLDSAELQRRGRARVARTAIVLLRDYSTEDVASLYDISGSALGRLLREETTASGRKLYSHRRRFKKTGNVTAEA